MSRRKAMTWTAVILAGGRGSRMAGREKGKVELRGRPLLQHLLDGLPSDVPLVVVGPGQAVTKDVTFVREAPIGGGPVAALGAALRVTQTAAIGLMAVDMPLVAPVISALVRHWSGQPALVPVDSAGHAQPLCAVYATDALRPVLDSLAPLSGLAMKDVLSRLAVSQFALPGAMTPLIVDIDTEQDLLAVGAWIGRQVDPTDQGQGIQSAISP